MALVVLLSIIGKAATSHAQALPGRSDLALSNDVRVDGPDQAAASHLARLDEFLANDQLEEVVDTLRRVMDAQGQKLISVGRDEAGGFVRYVSIRECCQAVLASLHARNSSALELYRDRVDASVERQFAEAQRLRDWQRLQELADGSFASSSGDRILWALGEWFLEQGDFAAARHAWQQLDPLFLVSESASAPLRAQIGSPLWAALRGLDLNAEWERLAPLLNVSRTSLTRLAFPDSALPREEIRFRQVLVSILAGEYDRAAIELDVFKRLHAGAIGQVAGKEVVLSAFLSSMLKDASNWSKPSTDHGWNAFGKKQTRESVSSPLGVVAALPLWSFEVKTSVEGALGDNGIGQVPVQAAVFPKSRLGTHPVTWGNLAFVAEPDRIRAVSLENGSPAWPLPDDKDSGVIYRSASVQNIMPGQHTLTLNVVGNVLAARLPHTSFRQAINRRHGYLDQGKVVLLDLQAQGRLKYPELHTESAEWVFEGTPVMDEGALYVSMRKVDGVRVDCYVACYDLPTRTLGADESLPLRWRSRICNSVALDLRTPHTLLTLRQGRLFYNSNLGMVASLRARDGRINWATQYPRAQHQWSDPDRIDDHFRRELTPCVVHSGMVFVAPSDCERIFALDEMSGRLIWTTRPETASDGVHLLGVSNGFLVVGGKYLYFLDAYNGSVVRQFPGPQRSTPGYAQPNPKGNGRGLVAGRRVYWPAGNNLHVLDTNDLEKTPAKMQLAKKLENGGNLMHGPLVLILATETGVHAYPIAPN